jgi:ribosomal-protein-alanine N-acetyltransferase
VINVRGFEGSDFKRVVEIEQASFGKDAWPAELFVQYRGDSPELFLVARLGRRIAGYSITSTNWRGAELESIAVDPRYRGCGVAQALLDSTLEGLRSQRTPALRLMVSTANTSALRFYRQYGFERKRLVKRYYGAGRDAWRMCLNLESAQAAECGPKPNRNSGLAALEASPSCASSSESSLKAKTPNR